MMSALGVHRRGRDRGQATLSTWHFYFLDILFVVCIWLIWASYPDLLVFDGGADHVLFSRYMFCFFAGPFLYGIRIAMYVAIFRKYKKPMTMEIRIIQISIGAFITIMVLGIFAGDLWASAHGYKKCFKVADRSNDYLYVLQGTECPPEPSLGEYLHPEDSRRQ
ncbi:hypothetical protein [Nitrospirillum sp. BR 11163]|uniref:hypothetical protein n=1 Tax=Nitrospirillum sp. BR 11163 TaxID=3104323 RepID=UPI002AFE0665|nr:hypothetical protein [Nitrospirillum sp. BR 11163]MEA1673595.1 hypothetical protein [Nitrospirillum sp. BR 11163]